MYTLSCTLYLLCHQIKSQSVALKNCVCKDDNLYIHKLVPELIHIIHILHYKHKRKILPTYKSEEIDAKATEIAGPNCHSDKQIKPYQLTWLSLYKVALNMYIVLLKNSTGEWSIGLI